MARNRTILTKEVLDRIPGMVANGANRQQIAALLGCNLGTLQVRCSQHGIKLCNRQPLDYVVVRLPRQIASAMRERAARRGETAQALVRRLLETIARDDLYTAVLDDEKVA